jgi:hypothetical protein
MAGTERDEMIFSLLARIDVLHGQIKDLEAKLAAATKLQPITGEPNGSAEAVQNQTGIHEVPGIGPPA